MLPAVLLHGRWAALRQCSHACQCLGCSRYLFRILLAYHFEIPSAGRWWSARSPTTDEARLSQRSVIAFGPRLEICAAQEVRAASVCRRPSDSELRGRNVHRLKEKRSVRSVPMPHARPCEITNAGGTQAGGGKSCHRPLGVVADTLINTEEFWQAGGTYKAVRRLGKRTSPSDGKSPGPASMHTRARPFIYPLNSGSRSKRHFYVEK
jgi:hypothetical protein